MGIAPSGGGTQYLSERVGRHRAMEIILTGELYDATTAAAYGWVNRAVPAAELDAFVDEFARNIANLPDGVARGVKQILSPTPPLEGYKREQTMLADLLAGPTVIPLMMKALEQGVQTLKGEKQLEQLVRSVTL